MDTVIQILFGPIQPFVWHPGRAYFVAASFAVLLAVSLLAGGGFKARVHGMILTACILWVLFGLNEHQARAKGWNIRVDLLLFWPILLVVSVASAWRGVCCMLTGEKNKENANKASDATSEPAPDADSSSHQG